MKYDNIIHLMFGGINAIYVYLSTLTYTIDNWGKLSLQIEVAMWNCLNNLYKNPNGHFHIR